MELSEHDRIRQRTAAASAGRRAGVLPAGRRGGPCGGDAVQPAGDRPQSPGHPPAPRGGKGASVFLGNEYPGARQRVLRPVQSDAAADAPDGKRGQIYPPRGTGGRDLHRGAYRAGIRHVSFYRGGYGHRHQQGVPAPYFRSL